MRQHPEKWEDMSNYLVHFTKGGNGVSGYDAMMSIYANCVLWPGRQFGIGKNKAPTGTQQEAVCFSEIPAGQWQRLEARRGTKYGLAFSKEYILSLGGGPVWYVWKDTPHWQTLQNMMASATGDADAPKEKAEIEYDRYRASVDLLPHPVDKDFEQGLLQIENRSKTKRK